MPVWIETEEGRHLNAAQIVTIDDSTLAEEDGDDADNGMEATVYAWMAASVSESAQILQVHYPVARFYVEDKGSAQNNRQFLQGVVSTFKQRLVEKIADSDKGIIQVSELVRAIVDNETGQPREQVNTVDDSTQPLYEFSPEEGGRW